jgi:hypothetical protein
MRMVGTGLHFAIGIELVGVGGYMGMTVLYFFESRPDCYRLIRTCLSRDILGLLCAVAFKGQPGRPSLQRTLKKSSSECHESPYSKGLIY